MEKFKLKNAVICSPANTHLDYINFLKKNINYLVEKPVIKDNQLKLFSKSYNKKKKKILQSSSDINLDIMKF